MTALQPFLPIVENDWIDVKDGNDTARALFDQHYSRYRYADGRKVLLFVGPGAKMVLLWPDAQAIFVWRKFISGDGQTGINCAVFRNEGAGRSSDLIRAACSRAWERWPGERLYIYVNPGKVRHKRDPGRCFLRAGWRRCGVTKWNRLLIFEMRPEWALPDFDRAAMTSLPHTRKRGD